MKNLKDIMQESLITEDKGIWVVELENNGKNSAYPVSIQAVCSSEKAAKVWCVEQSATYPAWKVQYSKGSRPTITGLWNEKTGDSMTITKCDIYSKESTDLQKID